MITEKTEAQRGKITGLNLQSSRGQSWYWNPGLPTLVLSCPCSPPPHISFPLILGALNKHFSLHV